MLDMLNTSIIHSQLFDLSHLTCSTYHMIFFISLAVNVAQLLKTCEKIEKEQVTLSNEKQCLFETFQAAEIKKHQLHHHAQFLYNYDDKLIQESMKIFKKKLYILKKKQNSA